MVIELKLRGNVAQRVVVDIVRLKPLSHLSDLDRSSKCLESNELLA